MRLSLILMVAFHILCPNLVWAAADSADFDADVEEAPADADAANGEAHKAKDREIKEREDTEVTRKQAAKQRKELAAKRQQTQKELVKAEKEMKALKIEQIKLGKQIKKQDADLAAEDKKLQKSNARLEKARAANAALKKAFDEKQVKMADLKRKSLAAAQEFDRSREEGKFAQQNLDKAKNDSAVRKQQLEKQIAVTQTHTKEVRERTAVMENEIRKHREHMQKLEQDAKVSQEEAQQSEVLLADTEERLTDVRSRDAAHTRVASQRRKETAPSPQSADARDRDEMRLKIEHAQSQQDAVRTVASTGDAAPSPVTLQLRSTAEASSNVLTMSRDCQIFEKPDGKSRVLGTKRAGSALSHAQTGVNWVSFPLQEGRKGFMPKFCF